MSVIIGLGAVVAVAAGLSQLEFWQRKEYRPDRVRAALRHGELDAGAWWRWLPLYLGAVISFGAYALTLELQIIVLILISISVTAWGMRVLERGLLRPRPTRRSIVVGLSLLLFETVLVWMLSKIILLELVVVIALAIIPLVAGAAVAFSVLPATALKMRKISRARSMRKAQSQLTVVGITGSFGKTSIKAYLAHFLEQAGVNFAVTQQRRNAEYPVALDMLEQLPLAPSVYVAEMGAYRRGEIQRLVRLAQPSVGVVAHIGTQHLDLFGSQEAIAEAKWELIKGLGLNGTAVLNADDPIIRKRGKTFEGKAVWYSTEPGSSVSVVAEDVGGRTVTANIMIEGKSYMSDIPVAGSARLSSVAAALAAARVLGVDSELLASSCASLPSLDRTMELYGCGVTTVIDDSYSANEAGAVMAVSHLRHFSGPRVVVLSPLQELGSEGEAVHEKIGQALIDIADEVLVTADRYIGALQRGFGIAESIQVVSDPHVAAASIAEKKGKVGVILLEGRVPEVVRRAALADCSKG